MKKISIAVLLSVFVASPVLAGNTYVGVNVGSNKITDSTPGSSAIDASTGFGILGGYSFNENVAAEAAYYNLGDATLHGTGGVTTALTGSVISVSAVGSLPLNKDFSLMAKLGYATSSISIPTASGNTADFIYGVGAQYNINKMVDVRLNYDMFKAGGGDFVTIFNSALLSVGAVFKM